ncbi:MAG TPA: xanthine dehydrogenase family protein subunit M [Stellaceae bacterium]|jgi:aerobic carbon-monoxide dehydrogenase medium subunit|nr:xanthine dehydrogenase family protein subunit M [Stellaceae bacterium]
MYPFAYHRPATVAEAVARLRDSEEARPLAGGQTLIPTLKQRLASPDALVDLKGIDGLDAIAAEGDGLRIGALTRHACVAASPLVQDLIPALARLAAGIGDPQVRNRGTLGGSIANNDPASDYPAALVGLGAVIGTSERRIAAEDFFTGLFETDLEPGEIVTEVWFPRPRRAGYAKFPNPASRYALAGVFVADAAAGIRVAVTGAGPCVFRLAEAERLLSTSFVPAALEPLRVPATGLNADIHADANYRAHLVAVMAQRAVTAALL